MTTLHGFDLTRDQQIPELQSRACLFRHQKTGAEVLSIENDDENKVFGVNFRTPPTDSTGLPHILEHSVLCGSRKYPLKEPFIELVKGSLKTFLNAMTYPDKTCYPVASPNIKDFYNLVDVYLDAVFHPRITPQILQQEGWHYELEHPDAQLIYKGVVFNEMKGAYSSPDGLLYRELQHALFPDTPYGHDSGGDPRCIPDLTYEQFKTFHTVYYHPSNARIFFYGDDDPARRLALLDSYLRDFDAAPVVSFIDLQRPFTAPRSLRSAYTMSADQAQGKKAMLTVGWMIGEVTAAADRMALGMLSYILLGTPASLLRKALLDSRLGDDLTGGGLNNGLRQASFAVGLKGIAAEDAPRIETLILDTLQSLAHEGIDPDTIDAAFNSFEFSLRENNTGSSPRGLSLMLRALSTWLHDGDPLAPLLFEAPLATLRQRLATGERLFENLITDTLIHNPHRVSLLLEPDPDLGTRELDEERARLDSVRASLDETALQQVIDATHELKRLQETPDSPDVLATLPSLTRDDLERQGKNLPQTEEQVAGVRTLVHDIFTNGIVYLEVGMNMRTLPPDLLPYLPLFSRSLLELGTEREDFIRLTQRIGRSTGGIWPASLMSSSRDGQQTVAWFFLRGKAVADKVGELLAIMCDMLLTVQLDNQARFRQLVLKARAGKEAGLVPGGNGVVSTRLSACFNEADWADEQIGGISNLFFLRDLERRVDADWPAVLAQLERIRSFLCNRSGMLCNITTDQATWLGVRPQLAAFLTAFPADPLTLADWHPQLLRGGEGLTIPAPVNYVGKGANIYQLGYQLHGSISVITRFLRTTWLWEKVRVQGGAYGGACGFDRHTGVFTFVSYRDPNLLRTLDMYDQTGTFLREVALSEAELTRTIIGAIGDIDGYMLPDAKGYTAMVRTLIGVTDASRQQNREEVLGTTAAHFRAFADTLDALRDHGTVVVLGSELAIQAANGTLPGLLSPVKVL